MNSTALPNRKDFTYWKKLQRLQTDIRFVATPYNMESWFAWT